MISFMIQTTCFSRYCSHLLPETLSEERRPKNKPAEETRQKKYSDAEFVDVSTWRFPTIHWLGIFSSYIFTMFTSVEFRTFFLQLNMLNSWWDFFPQNGSPIV